MPALSKIVPLVGAILSFAILFAMHLGFETRDIQTRPSPATTLQLTKTLAFGTSRTSIRGLALPILQARLGLPVRLKIPAIHVNAIIEHVGLTANGEMGIPKKPGNAAWFEPASRPGELGTAIIDGHFNWKNGLPGVFDKLSKLSVGDTVYVEDEYGATTAFVVNSTRSYGQSEEAGEVFGSNDGKAHLNLITCEGVWDASSNSYSKRLVVFADKEDQPRQ